MRSSCSAQVLGSKTTEFCADVVQELLVTPISEESFRMKIQSYADSHWKINLVPQHFLDIKYLLDQGYGLVDFRPYFQDILSVARYMYNTDQRVDK